MNTREFLQATNDGFGGLRETARLWDGSQVSIQASRRHYCRPKVDNAQDYQTVELGYPTGVIPDKFRKYTTGDGVYAQVPVEDVDEFVQAHGGIVPPVK